MSCRQDRGPGRFYWLQACGVVGGLQDEDESICFGSGIFETTGTDSAAVNPKTAW